MLLLSLVLAAAGPDRLDFQLMTSPAYTAFAARGEAMCPARKLRYLHPADLDFLEEGYLPTLPRRLRQRIVAAARRADRACTGEGASCPAQHVLTAIDAVGRLGPFTRYACAAST